MKVQISFAGQSDLKLIRSQLEGIKDLHSEFHHCFLPRHIIRKQGAPTDIIDMLDDVLGEKQVKHLQDCKTLEEANVKLDKVRLEVANTIDKLYVLGWTQSISIAKEIEFMSGGRVEILH